MPLARVSRSYCAVPPAYTSERHSASDQNSRASRLNWAGRPHQRSTSSMTTDRASPRTSVYHLDRSETLEPCPPLDRVIR